MKKKVFSLMMTLVLAFVGIARADVVEIGSLEGAGNNTYLPMNSLYNYSYTQQIYTAEEIGMSGTINSLTVWMYGNANLYEMPFNIYMQEVDKTAFSGTTDWVTVTPSDMVYTGSVTVHNTDAEAYTFILDTPFEYSGSGNLLVCFNNTTGQWTNGLTGKVFGTTGDPVRSIYARRDTPGAYDPYDPTFSATSTTYQRNVITLDITPGGTPADDQLHVAYMVGETQVVDQLNLGTRPANAWMEPFNFIMYKEAGLPVTVTLLDVTPSDGLFTFGGEELPFVVTRNDAVALTAVTNATQAGLIERQFVAITEGDRAAHIWPITVDIYAPEVPDVWELACQEATTFPFVEVPATAHNTVLHNDYTLPFPEIPEGYDAVYKLVFNQDQIVNAEVTYGANGKVALYTADFNGEGGPMATNNYTGIGLGGGGAAATPFEVQIGEGTSTTGYFPFYTLYNYSIAENLFLAAELEEAGVTSAPMTSLSWYATNAPGYAQQGITIWMANVEDTELTTTSHIVTGMTKVYTGAMTPAVGWNEFVFNEGTFSWDGHSNILIYCQRNNGEWNSTVSWQATGSQPFTAMSYRYQDSGAYDPTIANTMYTSTTRPNIIMKADGRNRDNVLFSDDFESGTLGNWTVVDADGDGENWVIGTPIAYGIGDPHSGTYVASSWSWNSVAYDPDNYMISPMVEGATSVNYFVATNTGYPDHYAVMASSTGTNTSDFSIVFEETAPISGAKGNVAKASTNGQGSRALSPWTERTIALPAGTKYVAFRHFNCPDMNYLFIDDVTIMGEDAPLPPTPPTPTPGGNTWNISAGPVIENLPVTPGTYYLVASSTTPNFEVTINAEDMPCPPVEGFAFNPIPADDEDEIEPASVTLHWSIPDFATGWRLIFGTTYYPDPTHPQTIMYPADGSFADGLANSYTVRNLWNNTNYFWRVEFNNDGCPDGVSSPVWGFTTHLNVPQNLRAADETVFDDEQIVLSWNAVVDRTYRMYNVYRDGELIGHTTVNNISNTTFTDGPLAYNMAGYTYYVTAVYDEGESAPSNTVNVKVSGYGDVNGHVYEQDGTTGIAGATVTMVGTDAFNVSHTYNFTTNAQGYYSGHIYEGTYNGQAAKDGYQTIYAPVQGNPIDITYSQTTSPIDYVLDENFDPVCAVIAEYYPDSLDPTSPYVKVYWGCGLPGSEIIEDFETGDFSMFDWQIDPTYPWSITTTSPYEGTYCMKSGGAGVASVTSNMTVSVEIPADGLMSFFGKISSESNYDYGRFYIDGVEKGSWSGAGNWVERSYDITAGTHTFQWRYTKDGSVNSNDDCFYVDYINFYKQPEPPIPGMTYTFEDGTMQGWTSVDADGDGYGWYMGSDIMTGQTGNNGSSDFVLSQSYYQGIVLYPDNYLVSPQVQLGGIVRFYACAQDASYAAEHFGLAVSTTNTNPSSFTMVQEWTMTAKDAPMGRKLSMEETADVMGRDCSREGNVRAQGNWYEYTVDLSAYSGTGYVAIRHFNCSDMFYLNVDDITIGEPGAKFDNRSLNHYRVYRTNCYNEGPYTEENTVLLATVWVPDTVYIDVEWADLPAGIYKWGVGSVYAGNRGELVEGPINWAAPVAINRDMNAEATDQAPVEVSVDRAPWDLLASFGGTSAGQQGVATDGNYIYTASWQSTPTGGYTFYKYDLNGNFIEGFNIAGATGIRDLTYDGQYFYGSSGAANIFKLDLVNKTLVGTITCSGATSRHCTYDPVRNGLWVGNWSTLALYDMNGALQFTAPAPTSAYGSAYIQDEAGEDHLYLFCQPSSDAKVFDYNITTNTLGTSAIFDFATTPGFNSGIAGGCFIAEYNGKIAFFGNVQQDPNLVGIYELRSSGTPGPGPGPTPGGSNLNQLALPRESETIWSNCLDKDMYLGEGAVDVTVLLNSADSPEGVTVSFTNLNEYEQEYYPVAPITMDETGYYAFDSFRRGDYAIAVNFEGYEPIYDTVSIWDATSLRYVMIEIIYGVSDLYVSSTGWAMWGAMGTPVGPTPGPGGNASTFSVDFEGGMPAGWTTIDANNDGYDWVLGSQIGGVYLVSGASLAGSGHNSSGDLICSGSYSNYTGSAITPDNYLVSPQVTLAAGSTFSFWACAQDASYAAEHFGVFISDNGTSNWTAVQEWTMTAKGDGNVMSIGRDGETRAQGTWRQYTVDLSAYAGQKYIAIRHFACNDQFILDVDDIELTAGAKGDERHLEGFKVLCTSIDGEPIYNANVPAEQPFCQLATDELVAGDHYIAKVAAIYSTGMSGWTETEWQYIPCENYAGTVNGVTASGNTVTWDYPGGGPGPGPGGQGSTFNVDFESGLPAGWTVVDGNNDGWTWCLTSAIPTTWTYYASLTLDWYHGGTNAICSGSYINGVGALNPNEWLISDQVTLAAGSQLSFWVAATDVNYAADHFGVFVSNTGTNPSDFQSVQEWTLTGKGGKKVLGGPTSRDGKGMTIGTWYNYTVDLSAYAGNAYIAFRHFNCTDQYIMCLDDIALTAGAKGDRNPWDLMMTFEAAEGGQYGVAFDGNNFYTSNWGYSAAAHNFYKYDQQGNMLEGFEIPGCGTLRGMTFDGDFTYGVANSSTVYTVDLANHALVNTFTSAYGAMRGITYDPERDGFWVIGNWSGNLTLIDRTGAIQQVGPAPTSASDLAYFKDDNDVEHIYCFNNGTNDVEDWVIGNSSMGGSVFNFSAVPGFASGSSGGCTVAEFNGKVAFMGDIQQSPNLIGIYELAEASAPGPGPGPQPSGDILGAMIFVDGEWEAFVEVPTNTYTYEGDGNEVCVRIVYNGTNNLPEGNIYFSMSCPECVEIAPAPGSCAAGAPIYAEELGETDQIKIWWGDQPQPPMSEWLYYDDGTYATSIGVNGGVIYWASMFPAASIASYAGTNLTKVALYENSYNTDVVTVNIYLGGTTAPGTLVSTMNYNPVGGEAFHEVALTTPVAIDGTQNLWIVFSENGTYPANACADTGDPNNRWVSLDGADWMDVATAGVSGYGWMIRGFVTNEGKGGMVENIALEQPAVMESSTGVLSHTEVVSKPADLSFMNRASIVKYNVYRSTDNATYTMIGEVAEDGSGYYEYIDSPAVGTYYYQVRALYDNDCESEPAVSGIDPSVNYVIAHNTGLNENNDNVALYPNPTNGNVTIEAAGMSRITVVSVLGQVVFDTELSADNFTLNMAQFNAGLYMVRVYTENGVTVKRVTVMQ